jgi:hypothetical protein
MIGADIAPSFAALTRRLTAKAVQLGQAEAERKALARRGDPALWRRPGLLWPLFTKG